jgi:outer membrane protein
MAGLLWASQAPAAQVGRLGDWIPALDRLAPELHGGLGLAVVQAPEYTGSDDYVTRLVPIVIASYKDRVYFRIKRAGVWAYQTDDHSFRLGFAIEPRGGFDPNDSLVLTGMDTRDTAWEAGLVLAWKLRPLGLLELSYLKDVTGASNGTSAAVKLSRPLYKHNRFSLVGSVSAEWISDKTADYYFGVRPDEALPTRPAYSASDTVDLGLAVVGEYKFNDRWRMISGASIRRLGAGAAGSPIVTERVQGVGYVGVGWGF